MISGWLTHQSSRRDTLERTAGESGNQSGYLWHPPGVGTTSYTPNTLNQYTAICGNTLGYDGNGNLNSDPTAPLGTSSYVWDLKNRLVSAINTQHSATYTYDVLPPQQQESRS